MVWFKRKSSGLIPQKKKDMPDLWIKCPECTEIIYKRELEKHFHVCQNCGNHFRIKGEAYLKLLLDDNSFKESHADLAPSDFLKFRANKKYADQIKEAYKKTQRRDALISGSGKLASREVMICVMDFSFIGGSMGSVVGEKIALAIDEAIARKTPFLLVSASGGARMMEGAISLMQMAKTSAKLAQLSDAGLPYIAILTDPTTGGVTASYAMLGDVNIAEPGALIGFAGPRVIKQTIGEDLPEGFQRAEFLLQHGFLDAVIPRPHLKDRIRQILDVLTGETMQAPENRNGQPDAELNDSGISPPVETEDQKN